MGKKYKLTDSELQQVVTESVVKILYEDKNLWEKVSDNPTDGNIKH